MFAWWKKSVACAGSVLFRGALPQQPGEFAFLQAQGIATAPLPETPSAYWGMALRHAQWGEATLVCLRDMPPLPPELIACQPLSDAERASARRGESTLTIRLEGTHGHVLRDRKHLLRFLRAVMADDGVAAVDHLSQLIWSREMLEDELSHDGDLDVEGLYCLHAILPDAAPAAEDAERQPCWIHSHGLQEIGEFDFDIVDPQAEVNSDLFRAIAFAIVERRMTLEMRRYRLAQPHGDVRPVAMARFLAQAEPRYRQLLADQVDAEHRTEHAVLCEPEGGLLSRWFARGLKPAKLLQRPPEHPLIFFSSEATDLMAQRARDSYGVFRRLREEFAAFPFPALVKLGYPVDSGGGHEHLWFEVHALDGDTLEATCLNAPYQVASLHEGGRGRHDAALLSDWMLITPTGQITPRSQLAARRIRPHREELLRALREDTEEAS